MKFIIFKIFILIKANFVIVYRNKSLSLLTKRTSKSKYIFLHTFKIPETICHFTQINKIQLLSNSQIKISINNLSKQMTNQHLMKKYTKGKL